MEPVEAAGGSSRPAGSPEPVNAGATPATVAGAPFRPRVGRALRRGLGGAYEYLGTVLAASALWIALAALLGAGGSGLVGLAIRGRGAGALLLPLLGGLAAAGMGTGPLTAALFAHVRGLLAHEDPYWWDLPLAVGRLWRRGLGLAGLQVGVSLIFTVDALFFLAHETPLRRGIGLAFIYPLLFWWSAALLQWPLAAERPADPLGRVITKSFLLVLDNLTFAGIVTTVVLGLTALCVAGPFGWIGLTLAWAGTTAFVQTAALRELLPKYALLVPPPEDDSSA